MTPSEETLLQAQFKSALVLIRHAVETVESEKQAEFFFRELDQEVHKLVPKFRKGNDLSQRLAKNRLLKPALLVLDSQTSG